MEHTSNSHPANFIQLPSRYAFQQARQIPTTARYTPATLTAEMLGIDRNTGVNTAKKMMPNQRYMWESRAWSGLGLCTTGVASPRSIILNTNGATRRDPIAHATVATNACRNPTSVYVSGPKLHPSGIAWISPPNQ